VIEERIEIRDGKTYKAFYDENGLQAQPAELIPDAVVVPTPRVKPLKEVINALITLKDDGTYDFSEAMQFTSWLDSTWAASILKPIFSMAEADISRVEADMLAQYIESEVRQGKLSEGIATKIGKLLSEIK
jgi:hypothetical protein